MSWVSLKSLGRVSLLAATASTAVVSFADELPAPIQALANQGLTIHGQFDAPGGMRGFGASVQGQDMAIYLTPDGEHAIIGTLVDGEGTDLTEAQLDEHVRAPLEPAHG